MRQESTRCGMSNLLRAIVSGRSARPKYCVVIFELPFIIRNNYKVQFATIFIIRKLKSITLTKFGGITHDLSTILLWARSACVPRDPQICKLQVNDVLVCARLTGCAGHKVRQSNRGRVSFQVLFGPGTSPPKTATTIIAVSRVFIGITHDLFTIF